MTGVRHYELHVDGCKHSLTYGQLLNTLGDIAALLRDTPLEQDPSRVLSCDVSAAEFRLSARACNVLRFGGVRTVGDLVSKTSVDLMKMRHCGNRTLHDIRCALARFGLALQGETAEVTP